jgi:type IV pilus assembly protein PilV
MRGGVRGISLIESLVAVAILSFGLIGLMRMQTRMVSAGTEAQQRSSAAQLADELLTLAHVDNGNVACYTLPQAGTCGSPAATARSTDWSNKVAGALPGTVTRSVVWNSATGRLTVNIGWTARDPSDPARQLVVASDVRN